MAKKRTVKRKPLELVLDCRCGARARVFELEKSYMSHCPGCGSLTFFHNPQLLERLRFGGQLCPHQPELKTCPGGSTSWCLTCRVRTFYRNGSQGK